MRRSISHPYILYKNAHNQDQTAYSYATRNDLVHYIVQMAWLAIKISHSGSWMQSSLHHLLPWGSNDNHCLNQLWWSELPLASGWGAHQFVARATNQSSNCLSMQCTVVDTHLEASSSFFSSKKYWATIWRRWWNYVATIKQGFNLRPQFLQFQFRQWVNLVTSRLNWFIK